jgi:hypothetical protein
MIDLVQVSESDPPVTGDIVRIGEHVFGVIRVVKDRIFMDSLTDGTSGSGGKRSCWVKADAIQFVHRIRGNDTTLRRHVHPDIAGRYTITSASEMPLASSPDQVTAQIMTPGTTLTISPQCGDQECLLWKVDISEKNELSFGSLQGGSIPTSDENFSMCAVGSCALPVGPASAVKIHIDMSFKGHSYQVSRVTRIYVRMYVWHEGDAHAPTCSVGVLRPARDLDPPRPC